MNKRNRQKGIYMFEYAMMIALIAVAAIATVQTLRNKLIEIFTTTAAVVEAPAASMLGSAEMGPPDVVGRLRSLKRGEFVQTNDWGTEYDGYARVLSNNQNWILIKHWALRGHSIQMGHERLAWRIVRIIRRRDADICEVRRTFRERQRVPLVP